MNEGMAKRSVMNPLRNPMNAAAANPSRSAGANGTPLTIDTAITIGASANTEPTEMIELTGDHEDRDPDRDQPHLGH